MKKIRGYENPVNNKKIHGCGEHKDKIYPAAFHGR